MSLFNPYSAFSVLGVPQLPTAPPTLRVMEGEASAAQLRAAQNAFTIFCTNARLSAVPNPSHAGRLADGSTFRIDVIGGQSIMRLWPVGAGEDTPRPAVAWTSFINPRFLPLWVRQTVSAPDYVPPGYPPPPKEPINQNPYYGVSGVGFYADHSGVTEHIANNGDWYLTGVTKNTTKVSLLQFSRRPDGSFDEGLVTEIGAYTVEGTVSYSYADKNGQITTYSSAHGRTSEHSGDVLRDESHDYLINDTLVQNAYKITRFPIADGNPTGSEIKWFGYESRTAWTIGKSHPAVPESSYNWDPDVPGSGYWYDYTMPAWHSYDAPNGSNGGITAGAAALQAQADAMNAPLDAAFAEEVRQWEQAYRDWYNNRPGIPNAGEFFTPLRGLRAAGRASQLEATRQLLLQGIDRNPHLNARLLSFPFNIGVSATPPEGVSRDGGWVTHHEPTYRGGGDNEQKIVRTVITAARQHTVVPAKDFSPNTPGFEVDPPFLLRRDFLPAGPLFHWTLDQFEYSERNMNRLKQPHDEYEMFPAVWPTAGVLQLPDYSTPPTISKCPDGTCVIDHDVFVPPGTKITIVYLEYEVYDLFSDQWFWTPCPAIMLTDSVWVKDLANFTDDPRLISREMYAKTRACRVWKILKQRRLTAAEKEKDPDAAGLEWSLPEVSDPDPESNEQKAYIAFAEDKDACPMAVVMAEELGVWPAQQQVTNFPFGARFIERADHKQWVGTSPEWDVDPETADMRQFNWMAIRALGTEE